MTFCNRIERRIVKIIGGRRDVAYLILMASVVLMVLAAMALLDSPSTNATDEPLILGFRRSQFVMASVFVVQVAIALFAGYLIATTENKAEPPGGH